MKSYNPATGEEIWQGKAATPADIDAAIRQAEEAFPAWSNKTVRERYDYLAEFGTLLRSSQAKFAEIISQETGKPLWDAMGETEGMINKAKISFDAYQKRCEDLIREQPHLKSITRHRPHGVVAVLGPYNFPGHLPNGHIMPALLAGNTVVFKPSDLTPLVAEETLRLWENTGIPKGVIQLLQGGKSAGEALVNHHRLKGLFFTGSYQTGQMLAKVFPPNKILALEMGGNNPLIVGEISDLPAAAYTIVQSAYLTSGQRCTCARRLILQDTKLLEPLMQMIRSITVGPYTQKPEPFMGPVISNSQAEHLLKAQESLRAKGGKILIPLTRLEEGKPFLTPGLMDVTSISELPDEEIFGPFLQVIRTKNFKESLIQANKTKYGLAAGLLSQNREEYAQFYREIEAGIVNWNAPLTGASSGAPFGGIKCSGNFRPSAFYAADYCAYPVASYETPELKMPKILNPGISWQ